MKGDLVNLFYLATAVTFIFGLKLMTNPRTARAGNALSAAGMLMAICGLLWGAHIVTFTWIVTGLIIGTIIGAAVAIFTPMTSAPQMVSFFNGSGGLAAGLVAISHAFLMTGETGGAVHITAQYSVTAGVGVAVGLLSFSGSGVAVGKLQDWLSTKPIILNRHRLINLGGLLTVVGLIVLLGCFPQQRWLLVPLALVAIGLGVMVTLPIGGADMPVVISMLNSMTGLAAAATGFLLSNTILIIAGALVGASGSILTRLMCRAMNRPLGNVLFGSFGRAAGAATATPAKTVRSYGIEDVKIALQNASSVVIIPGYGLAVARAQHAVKEMADILEANGVSVKYAIHPVAGRMPGHMNVLLAEADVPYGNLLDIDAANAELDHADVALVIGANDVVNPAARTDHASPIYGMPILNADHARTVIVSKRSMATGFAGIDNPLFYEDKTMMVFGDAKETFTALVAALKGGQ